MKTLIKKMLNKFLLFFILFQFSLPALSSNFPANNFEIVDHAKSQMYSIVDTNFRISWVLPSEHDEKIRKNTKKIKTYVSLAGVKVGNSQREVKKILKTPVEKRFGERLWLYGEKLEDGSYENLIQVFFDEPKEKVIGITTFDQNYIIEDIGIKIGDSIDNVISMYGEPADDRDFIEDSSNKHYMGLYYLYPKSGIGFLIGKGKTDDLLVKGVIVFGES